MPCLHQSPPPLPPLSPSPPAPPLCSPYPPISPPAARAYPPLPPCPTPLNPACRRGRLGNGPNFSEHWGKNGPQHRRPLSQALPRGLRLGQGGCRRHQGPRHFRGRSRALQRGARGDSPLFFNLTLSCSEFLPPLYGAPDLLLSLPPFPASPRVLARARASPLRPSY